LIFFFHISLRKKILLPNICQFLVTGGKHTSTYKYLVHTADRTQFLYTVRFFDYEYVTVPGEFFSE